MSPLITSLTWLRSATAGLVLLTGVAPALAVNGTWNTATSGLNWSTAANWTGSNIASGSGAIADFTTVNITGTSGAPYTYVYVDQNYTIGTLKLGDPVTAGDYALWNIAGTTAGAILTLDAGVGKPVIQTTSMAGASTFPYNVISAPLAGTNGFEKTGSGFVTISGNQSRLSGEALVTQGRLNILGNMNNVSVTLAATGTLTVGNSAGLGTSIAGLNSTGTNGLVTYSSNSRTLVLTGNGSYSFGGVIYSATPSTGLNDVAVAARLGASGVQTLTNTTSAYGGGTVLSSGTLVSASASTTGTPFGVGVISLQGGNMKIAPTATSGDVSYTGVTGLLPGNPRTLATAFRYGAGSLTLDKGAANSLTYTIGNTSAAKDAVLARSGGTGTMMLATGGGISTLGTSENFVVNGNSGDSVTVVNGISTAAILGRVSLSDTDADATFLTYGASGKTGFSEATYSTSTNINGGTAYTDTRVFQANSGTTNALTADSSVYALRVDGVNVSGAFTLNVGANASSTTHSTGIILNGGSITTTNISLGSSPLVIYTNAEGGLISSNITASGTTGSTAPAVSFTGPGTLTLSGTNTFRAVAINDGTVSVTSDSQLGTKSSATDAGTLTMRNGTLKITSSTALTNRAISLNGLDAGSNGIFAGSEGGTFEVVGAGTTVTYAGTSSGSKIITGVGSFTKSGAGTFSLGGTSSNTYSGRTIVTAGTLLLNGTAGLNMISSTGASGDNLTLTDVQVSGGKLQWGANNQIVDTAKVALNGGTLALNGRAEGPASADGVGFLNVFASSTIDFGVGDNGNILRFSSINLHTDATVLSITNWNGTANFGNGSERLLFSGTDTTAFTSIFDQNEVSFNGTSGYVAVQFSGYYEIVAVPEPMAMVLLVIGGLCLVVFRRRRTVAEA